MASTSRSRPYGSTITKSDMEASSLVFVYVRDAKPKRKVAVPIPEGYTWAEFIQQVKTKLRISGVKEIYHSGSGQHVTSLDDLQDIDVLCVVEGEEHPQVSQPAAATASDAALRQGLSAPGLVSPDIEPQAANGSYRQQLITPDRHKVVVAPDRQPGPSSQQRDDDEKKYTRRAHPLRRMLQRVLPGVFAPTLPVSSKDLPAGPGAVGPDTDKGTEITRLGRRRKVRRSALTPRNILMILAVASCVITMLWFMLRTNPGVS